MNRTPTPLTEPADLLPLLRACDLPVGDIAPGPAQRFFGLRGAGGCIAVVGLEPSGALGLLRSLAVAPAYRGQGVARQLVAYAETQARALGVERLFLLTTDAAPFFTRLGYAALDRAAAPPAIRSSAQFAGLCPASASLLCKTLGAAAPGTQPLQEAAQP